MEKKKTKNTIIMAFHAIRTQPVKVLFATIYSRFYNWIPQSQNGTQLINGKKTQGNRKNNLAQNNTFAQDISVFRLKIRICSLKTEILSQGTNFFPTEPDFSGFAAHE